MLTTTDGAELTPSRSRAAALLRGVLQAYVTSLLPYAVSLSIFLILATVVPPISYFIFLLWFAFLLFLGLALVAPFFAWPLRHIPIGSTFSTLRALWTALGVYLAGFVVTVVGMWIVSLFYETGGGIVEAAGVIGWHALFLIPGALIVWGLLSLLERFLHKQLSGR